MNFVKQGVGEMCIARPDQVKNLLVYKHPDETIPWKAFLTVDSDEAAVFFKDGQVHGVLGPGRMNLDANNIPFLSNLIDRFTGGNVLKSEVFFVTTKPVYDVPVGGRLGMMEDPMLGELVEPRFFGKIAIQVVDPGTFILNYTGQRATTFEEQVEWIKGVFMNTVKTVVGRVCIAQERSLMQTMGMQDEFKKAFMESAPDLNNIGVRVVDVGAFDINLSNEDKATLKEAQAEIGEAKRAARKAKIAIAQAEAEAAQREHQLRQDFQYRAQYANLAAQNPGYMMAAQADAVRGAGEGMAKGGEGGAGIANLGAQMAVGVGMAGMFNQGFAPQQQPVQRVQAPAGGTVTCPKCNSGSPGGKFCANCGSPLAPPAPPPQPQAAFCSNCGKPVQGKFCANCGAAAPGGA
ncbi:MAG: SPFH domain-containing protein, partial [Deltaproteobacteria bacterium]|nr:SPFH domain-containing protein [Deltaproteobacteria bacterium]MBW2533798.1 SPFH domain-containing protein [Deltaproteobacteria bacterium]